MRRHRSIRKLTFPFLPTVLTLCNGACGLFAIMLVTSELPNLSKTDQTFYAALLIFLGMVFDVLDGQVARMTKQTSRFGKELDSLSDMVTFGTAPVFIMLTYSGVFQLRFLIGVGVLYFAMAMLRLARFNVQKNEHAATHFFQGLPTPMAAGTLASFAIAMPALEQLADSPLSETSQELGQQLIWLSMILVPVLTGVLGWLMVSRVRYPHVARELGRRRSFSQVAELVFALVVAVTLHELALPVLFCYFVFAPLVNQVRQKAFSPHGEPSVEPVTLGASTSPDDQ